jgi:hypothetical protein
MNLLEPIVIDDAKFVASTVAENDAPAWAVGTTYAAGAVVMYSHRLWKSLQDSNTGHTPGVSVAWWVATGPTNRWAMFDRAVGTQSVGPATVVVVLAPGEFDTLALLETQAAAATVALVTNGQTVYTKTRSFENAGDAIDDWYEYFFAPVGRAKSLVFENIPRYAAATVYITLAHESEVRCGVMALGTAFPVGEVLAKPSLTFTDYSRKETNDFGVTDIVERPFAKRNSLQVKIPTSSLDALMDKLSSVRAKPSVYLADAPLDWLRIYGLCRRAEATVEYVDFSYVSMDIEGLI